MFFNRYKQIIWWTQPVFTCRDQKIFAVAQNTNLSLLQITLSLLHNFKRQQRKFKVDVCICVYDLGLNRQLRKQKNFLNVLYFFHSQVK